MQLPAFLALQRTSWQRPTAQIRGENVNELCPPYTVLASPAMPSSVIDNNRYRCRLRIQICQMNER